MKEKKYIDIKTPTFRVDLPSLASPCVFDSQNKPVYLEPEDPRYKDSKFGLTMIYNKEQIAKDEEMKKEFQDLKAAIEEVIEAAWPGEKKPEKLRRPFRDGDVHRSGREQYLGALFASATKYAVSRKGVRQKVDLIAADAKTRITDASEIYSGCYCKAIITVHPYHMGDNLGVTFGLKFVQKVADGEPFSNAATPDQLFSAVDNGSWDLMTDLLG